MSLNENKNIPKVTNLPKYEGKQILKVLNIVIGEDEAFYNCILEDGTIKPIPVHIIEGGES